MEAEAVQRLQDQPQYYAEHLSGVNETHEVVSTEDIFNEHGMLIARKGTRIDSAVSHKILKHKLAKPLHVQVAIQNRLTEQLLHQEFQQLLEQRPDLAALVEGAAMTEEFADLVPGVRLPRQLLQSLTVLRLRQPEVYQRSLAVSLLATVLARALGLSPAEVRAAYIAGLAHDIGLLHIDPAILDKGIEELSAQEWRALQSHVVVGKLLLEEVADQVPPLTALAVLEHHERCDRSGYPLGRAGTELHVLGQLIGLADSLEELWRQRLAPRGLNLAHAVPFLQLNAKTHFSHVYETMRQLLKRARLRPAAPSRSGGAAEFAAHLRQRASTFEQCLPALSELDEAAAGLPLEGRLRSLRWLPGQLLRRFHAAGVVQPELCTWLAAGAEDAQADVAAELTDLELLQLELRDQLHRLRLILAEYLTVAAQPPPPVVEARRLLDACVDALPA